VTDPTVNSSTDGKTRDDAEVLALINERLNSLPPACRRAFILVRYHGKSFEVAAAEMGLSSRQVRKFAQRAFAECKRVVEEASRSNAT